MSFPSQGEIEIPLLRALAECGGSAKPRAVYPKVAANFPDLTAAEQEQRLESSPSTRKWWNLVQWVRQALVSAGEIDGSTRGVWTITPRGTARLAQAGAASAAQVPPAQGLSLRDLANRSRDEAKSRLLTELRALTPTAFEHFCSGVFITTSRFTKDATAASYKKGAISILLLDGDAVVELMLERGLGVARQPLYLYEVDDEFFDFEDGAE